MYEKKDSFYNFFNNDNFIIKYLCNYFFLPGDLYFSSDVYSNKR